MDQEPDNPVSVPCPLCWGQGYILEPLAGIYIPVMCEECVGKGTIRR